MELVPNAEYELPVSLYVVKLLYNSGLIVAPTLLPNCAFLGLFAGKRFSKGEVVCKYVGDRYRTGEAIRLKDKSYLMRLGEQSYVDAQPHAGVYARYMNDCINPEGWNVEFVKLPDRGCALVVALRDIECYEELFVSYGKRYWMLQKPVKLSGTQLKALRETLRKPQSVIVT
jgi:SET domain-containing protein